MVPNENEMLKGVCVIMDTLMKIICALSSVSNPHLLPHCAVRIFKIACKVLGRNFI